MNMGRVFEKESIIKITTIEGSKGHNELFLIAGVHNLSSKEPTRDHHYGHGGKEESRICHTALNCIEREEG